MYQNYGLPFSVDLLANWNACVSMENLREDAIVATRIDDIDKKIIYISKISTVWDPTGFYEKHYLRNNVSTAS